MDTLLDMCLQGSAMVAIVLALRALFFNRLPKATFYVLWLVVLARLLVPVQIAVPINAWTALETARPAAVQPATPTTVQAADTPGIYVQPAPASTDLSAAVAKSTSTPTNNESALPGSNPAIQPTGTAGASESSLSAWHIAWSAGALLALAYFSWSYVRQVKLLGSAQAVDGQSARQWLSAHRLPRRALRVVESDLAGSPLTYGVLHPTIVVPSHFDWTDRSKSTLVLEHEFVHVKRFDVLIKALLVAALCLHWFNPLVWAMFAYANRDIELSCDEAVARLLNCHGRSLYAHALIDAVESSGKLAPAFSGSFKNPIGERIMSLRHVKPATAWAAAVTAALSLGITWAFATTASPKEQVNETAAIATAEVKPTITDQTVQWAECTYDYDDPWGREIWTITTPLYSITVPDASFPNGFEWTFTLEHTDPAPQGMTHVTVITDKATGEIAYVTYCYPRDPAYPQYSVPGELGEMPGYVLEDEGRSESDLSYGVAGATPEELWNNREIIEDCSPFYGPIAHGGGFLSMVYGIEPTAVTQEAFIAYAQTEEEGVRIVTPYYSVLVPHEEIDGEFSAMYREGQDAQLILERGGSSYTHSLGVRIEQIPGIYATSFSYSCVAPDSYDPWAEPRTQIHTGILTPDGLEIVVETSSSYYDGEDYYIDNGRAYEEALKYASWIEPV